jgi:SOS response regulatory protein OraA/RecX
MPTQASQNQQLADYIKKNLSKGYTPDSLRYALMNQGYSRTSVEKAMEIANKQLAQSAPKIQEKPIVTYSYDEEEMKNKIAQQDANQGNFLTRFLRKLFG